MARFVHIADSRSVAGIRRNGLTASRCRDGRRGVFCVPVTPNGAHTFQWARELRRRQVNSFVAVFFVIPDQESVLVGHYGQDKATVTAAGAHELFRSTQGPLGLEVLVPRSIGAEQVKAVGPAPRITGWRFFPEAKGRTPFWPQPGTRNAARLRRAIERRHGWE